MAAVVGANGIKRLAGAKMGSKQTSAVMAVFGKIAPFASKNPAAINGFGSKNGFCFVLNTFCSHKDIWELFFVLFCHSQIGNFHCFLHKKDRIIHDL